MSVQEGGTEQSCSWKPGMGIIWGPSLPESQKLSQDQQAHWERAGAEEEISIYCAEKVKEATIIFEK